MSAASEREDSPTAGGRGRSSWFSELRRRKVFRVLAAYGVVAWLLLQIIDLLSGAFPLPDWTLAVATVGLAAGFPVVAALSWAFQVTPEGLVLDIEQAKPLSVNRSRLIHFIDVIIICILLVVVVYLSLGERFARNASEPIRIAVLPFQNLSGDEGVAYLSDGIADDIRARLYEIPQLLLAARSSTAAIFGKGLDIRTIGDRLTVDHVLEGTIRKSGDRIRVSVELVDVATGVSRWVKTYDTRFDDVLEMQNNISLIVASELEILLTKDVRRVLARNPTDDPVAYDFYLQAREYLRRPRTGTNIEAADTLFRSAIEQDPGFALGYAGLCSTYVLRYFESSDVRHIADAESNCQHAIALDPTLSEVHAVLGQLYVSVGRWDSAETSFRKAIELDPKNIEAFAGIGDVFVARGDYVEAEARYRAAIEVLPGNWSGYNRLAYFLLMRGRLQEAADTYLRVVEFTPDNPSAYNNLGVTYYLMGRFEDAASNYRRSLDLNPSRSAYSNTGTMYYLAGDFEQAVSMFEKATEQAGADYKLWGNLADAQRFVEGLKDTAKSSYRKAIELAMTETSVATAKADDLTNLAWYHANLGEREMAERYLESAAGMPNETGEQLYITGLVHTLLGNAERAEAAILRAKELGISDEILEATPELRNPAPKTL